jgi:hypothetical protein
VPRPTIPEEPLNIRPLGIALVMTDSASAIESMVPTLVRNVRVAED